MCRDERPIYDTEGPTSHNALVVFGDTNGLFTEVLHDPCRATPKP
jgi:hypothetical protein